MKKTGKLLLVIAGSIALVLVILYQTGMFEGGKIAPGEQKIPKISTEGKKVLVIKKVDIPQIYHAVGTIHSRTEVELAARLTARILEVKARSGDIVKKDQVLIQLDKSDLNAMLAQAKGRLAAAQSTINAAEQEINKAKAAFQLAQSNLKRDTILFNKKVIPKKVIEATQSQFEQASSSLSQAKQYRMQAVSAREAALGAVKEITAKLSYATIKSPFSGVVSNRLADPGDLASPGIILMTIFDPKRIMFYVPISESLVRLVKIGTLLQIKVPAINEIVEGKIREIVPSIDAGSRTFLVKICILKNDLPLMPGMFGTLNFEMGTKKAIIIPNKAIEQIGQLKYVELKNRDGSVEKQLIRTAKYNKGHSEVIAGLKAGDEILIKK